MSNGDGIEILVCTSFPRIKFNPILGRQSILRQSMALLHLILFGEFFMLSKINPQRYYVKDHMLT